MGSYIVAISLGIVCTTLIMLIEIHGSKGESLPNWAKKILVNGLGRFLFVGKIEESEYQKEKVRYVVDLYVVRYTKSYNIIVSFCLCLLLFQTLSVMTCVNIL